jgi:hypothetical protein
MIKKNTSGRMAHDDSSLLLRTDRHLFIFVLDCFFPNIRIYNFLLAFHLNKTYIKIAKYNLIQIKFEQLNKTIEDKAKRRKLIKISRI